MARTASPSSSRSVALPARPQQRPRAEKLTGLNAVLAELLAVGDSRGWVVTCYQKLEPGDRAGEKYRIKLKNRLRRAAERLGVLGFAHADREAVTRELERVGTFFRHPANLSGGRGIAVFAARGLFRVVQLPYVLKSRVMVDRTPVVGELVALAETGSRLLAVVADRRSARFFDVGLDAVTELDGLPALGATRPARFHGERGAAPGGPRRTGSTTSFGVGEYRFHNRIREEHHRHLASVAEGVAVHLRSQPFDGLVVGGIGVDASALLPYLAPAQRSRVLGVLRLAPRKVSAAEIRDRSLELLAEAARRTASEAVGELVARRASGWVTESVEPTLRALARGQVRTLLVDADAEVAGYRCSGSGRLTESPAAGRSEGEVVPVADLLDDAIEEALRQRARVAVVHGAEARRFDRLAAVLRFRTSR
jgi:peptide chain release factor subunit 1